MKSKLFFKIITFSLLLSFTNCLFAEDHTPEPYDNEEFPQGLKDLRRFEIVSLGAMPFVLLDTNLVYSSYLWVKNDFSSDYSPNPFAASSNTYSEGEMIGIICTSLGISVGIGLTDLIINIVKRNKKAKLEAVKNKNINIYNYTPIEQDPDAIKIDMDSSKTNEDTEVENLVEEISEVEE